jgi:adenosylhomocysteine nucleosidase
VETILVVAADRRELADFAPRLSGRRSISAGLDYSEEGQLGGRRWLLAANGAGPRLAAAAVRAFRGADRVVSTGYCGALDPALAPSDIVICNRVIEAETNRRFRTADEFGATCLSGDKVIQTSREKQLLRGTTGASVVEMEAAGVAAETEAMGRPFHCIRVVTDTADEDISLDLNAARDGDGRIRPLRVALSSLKRPRLDIPELMKLNRRPKAASVRLGEYLASHGF